MRSEGDVYHVVARGTGRQLIFEDESDRRLFLSLLSKGLSDYDAVLYAWCLMGNHVHLLIRAPIERLSQLMKMVLGTYARRFNEKTARVGHLFQSRYGSEPITDDEYLLTVIRYIHENPRKAGLASTEAYPWSSYGEYIGSAWLCDTDFPLSVFGGVDAFRRFHGQPHDEPNCLDADKGEASALVRKVADECIIATARDVLGEVNAQDLKTLPIQQRNACLRMLKEAGLSVRQIERLTGIGRNIVQRVK